MTPYDWGNDPNSPTIRAASGRKMEDQLVFDASYKAGFANTVAEASED